MTFDLSQLFTALFILLLITTFYFLMRMFTYIDPVNFQRYRLLGLFALLFPGVLKPGGLRLFLMMIISAGLLFATGLCLFEFDEYLSGSRL